LAALTVAEPVVYEVEVDRLAAGSDGRRRRQFAVEQPVERHARLRRVGLDDDDAARSEQDAHVRAGAPDRPLAGGLAGSRVARLLPALLARLLPVQVEQRPAELRVPTRMLDEQRRPLVRGHRGRLRPKKMPPSIACPRRSGSGTDLGLQATPTRW